MRTSLPRTELRNSQENARIVLDTFNQGGGRGRHWEIIRLRS